MALGETWTLNASLYIPRAWDSGMKPNDSSTWVHPSIWTTQEGTRSPVQYSGTWFQVGYKVGGGEYWGEEGAA